MNTLFALLSCADPLVLPATTPDTTTSTPGAIDTGPPYVTPFYGTPLSDTELLRRLSLDLRGVLPTVADLQRVEADPAALNEVIDEYMADPRYEDRLVDIFAERYLTRSDVFNVSQDDYHLDESMEFVFESSVGAEPLRLLAHVAMNDLPWTDIVTADYTIANDTLAGIWPLDYPEGATGWQVAYYTDDRPPGGVIMTNGLWWRYYTTPNNYNRSRASAITRLLLCEDYLLRPITFEAPSLLDREDLNEATRSQETCAGCHSTLDPLASALFGFWWFDLYDTAEMTSYHAEREQLGTYYLEMAPGYFGTPIDGAAQLGPMIAADDRFVTCAVEQMAEALWRRTQELDDFPTLVSLEQSFRDSGLKMNDLIRAIVATDHYRVGGLTDDAPESAEELYTTRRLMSVEQLSATVEDLTAFTWTWEGFDQLANDETGFRILGGGLDGINVTKPQRDPTISRSLVIQRVAQAAAQTVVQREMVDDPKSRVLFTLVDPDIHRPGDEDFRSELGQLHRRLHGTTPDDTQIALDEALWQEVHALSSSPTQAWTSLLVVMMRDPAFWTY